MSPIPPDDPEPLPYARQGVDENDITSVEDVLRSDWLTTGPKVEAFEGALAETTGADHAVAVSSGTAALHAAVRAAGLGEGDEVLVPPMTFAATANAVIYEGGRPVFADVDPDSLLLDPELAKETITDATEAIVAVDYTGHPCDYDALQDLAEDHDLTLIADGCHALGAAYKGEPVGALADLTAFSFHPVKHITTAEGGAVTADDPEWVDRMRRFRDHGRTTNHDDRPAWYYEVKELGWNYRLSDVHCALGLSQLQKLRKWVEIRRGLASTYRDLLADVEGVEPLAVAPEADHAYHLFVVRIEEGSHGASRDEVYHALRDRNIGTNVHYIPLHLHPLYQEHLGTGPGDCPVAEAAYDEILTLPLFPGMEKTDVERVVRAIRATVEAKSP